MKLHFRNKITIDGDNRRRMVSGLDKVLHGGFITSTLFKRYFFAVLLAVALIMMSISVRFDCVTAMETIASLRTRLQVVRTELQRERSAYMSTTRESAMQARVDSLGLGLGIQQRPPYKLPPEP